MRFHEAANFLFDLRRFPSRPGTEATAALLAHLDDPHEAVPTVQIAGSNGKGSTARMVESVLSEAGLDVGLYTSPHLDDVRERIRVNERPIPESAVVDFVESIEEYVTDHAADGESPTFFETITALALWEFDRRDVDVAVLEVGIGGRHDATSVVDPVASAVTAVTLEHTDVLGDDVETIARDKASVAPAERNLVTAASGDALAAIREETDPLVVSAADDAPISVEYGGRDGLEGVVEIETPERTVDTRLPLLGAHQARNAGVAVALVEQLADADVLDGLETATLARGLRNAHWPGRFEVMGRDPLVVLDGAHNPGGVASLAETLDSFEYEDLHVVVGAMADKDHREMAAELSAAERVTACEPDRDRAEDEPVIARAFENETGADVGTRSDVEGAVADAIEAAGPDDCVLVTGSLYTVAEARTRWSRAYVPKRADTVDEAREILEDAHVTDAGVWRMGGKGVHRVVKTRVRPRQAQYLKEELLSLGGECSISGLNDQDEEPLSVVLMATMAQFRRLCEKLQGQPYGLAPLGEQIRETLGIDVDPDACGYPWEDSTAVMGILNVTPDSFHDGGEFEASEDAIARAREMADAGADIIDIGGESTRPGADPVPASTEQSRIVPVIEELADLDVLVSVDTRKAEVARAALDAGADILNDVSGLADPKMRLVAAEYEVPVVVMHSIDAPVVPGKDVPYDDVVEDVIDELTERVLLAEKAGLDRSQIIVDPGFGFGKTPAEDFDILGRLDEFRGLGCPLMVGHSHKSMFEQIGRDSNERYEPTIVATALAAERGADIVRVHDVAANVAAVDVVERTDGE
ncbi:dihydropteroate synthase [Halovenus marina]|uniref:dihydropteroate synthase n=1 Tax=Halovenus marina TaxID=3396621 RepID=UPI003F5769E5